MTAPWEPPDFWSMHARKLLSLPEDWRWTSLEAIPGGDGRDYSQVKGAIPFGVRFKSGPRKGEINWAHRREERTVVIPFKEHHAFIAAWEDETGLCHDCGNTGQATAGWLRDEGAKYAPCRSDRHARFAPKPLPPAPEGTP